MIPSPSVVNSLSLSLTADIRSSSKTSDLDVSVQILIDKMQKGLKVFIICHCSNYLLNDEAEMADKLIQRSGAVVNYEKLKYTVL